MTTVEAAVLGAGSWGTALAKLLAENGHQVRLWAHRDEEADAINADRENREYLPGFDLPENLQATADMRSALDGAELVMSVVPTQWLRGVLEQAAPLLPKETPIVSCTKGIENSTLMLVSEMFAELIPQEHHPFLTYLAARASRARSRPEVPTAVSLAGRRRGGLPRGAGGLLMNDSFRVYTTEDVMGSSSAAR